MGLEDWLSHGRGWKILACGGNVGIICRACSVPFIDYVTTRTFQAVPNGSPYTTKGPPARTPLEGPGIMICTICLLFGDMTDRWAVWVWGWVTREQAGTT